MIEFPGHTSTGCANCHSINHQTHDCPYLQEAMLGDVRCDQCDKPLDLDIHTLHAHVTALCDECGKDWMIVLKERPR